jgi:hypothetical protein
MFTTKPLGSIKHLLNQPIALSPRDSQKLLQSITSSFRRTLDRAHGFESEADPAAPPVAPSSSTSSTSPSAPRTSTAATDEHIRSILANPLLTQPKQPDAPAYKPRRFSHSQLEAAPFSPNKPQRPSSSHNGPTAPRRSPVDVFDQAVARGMMTRRAATGCMVAVQSHATLESGPTSRILARSRMGSRVLDWLRASGQEQSLDFLTPDEDGAAFVRMLMPFILAEGLEGRVWDWIDRLIGGEVAAVGGIHGAGIKARLLIDRLVVAKHAHSPTSIGTAIDDVARVDLKLASHPGLQYILYPAWSYLARLVLAGPSGDSHRRGEVSATGFDKLLGLGGHIRDIKASILSAHLRLHHPTEPTCEPAMAVFRRSPGIISRPTDAAATTTAHGADEASNPTETAAMALAKDTLAFLVNSRQYAEARSFSEVMGLDMGPSLRTV